MLAFVFPGQGSQKRGMGKALFDEVTEFTSVEPQIDALLGYSIRELCLEDPHSRLNNTEYTQPALYLVNALHYFKAVADGKKPAFLAGHSLGEYNALLAAGAFDLLTGLRLVQKRGALMAQARNGSMAAVLGIPSQKIVEIIQENGLSGLDVANYNSPTQTVISGPLADIERAKQILANVEGAMCIVLPVSAAFHSRYMTDASVAFGDFLETIEFAELKMPVMSNVTGSPYPSENPNAVIKSLLVKQIAQPVLWTQSIRYLTDHGVTEFSETGPGAVLTGLIRQIQKAAAVRA